MSKTNAEQIAEYHFALAGRQSNSIHEMHLARNFISQDKKDEKRGTKVMVLNGAISIMKKEVKRNLALGSAYARGIGEQTEVNAGVATEGDSVYPVHGSEKQFQSERNSGDVGVNEGTSEVSSKDTDLP